jgi:aspartate/tyrosine/aromatic aminotransferase
MQALGAIPLIDLAYQGLGDGPDATPRTGGS